MSREINRRQMLKESAVVVGAAALPGLSSQKAQETSQQADNKMITKAGGEKSFPFIEFSASDYRELGAVIGETFSAQIRTGLDRRKKFIDLMKSFVQADPVNRYDPFIKSLDKHFPQYLEELKGEAEGAGVPFMDLMVLNLNPELTMMMRKASASPDCSTVISATAGRAILAHNEDGSKAYGDSMFILKIKAPGKVTFLCMSYPGIIAGNAPGFNDQGLAHSCNFIGAKEVRPGVPRYFLDRAMLEARDLDEAVALAAHPARAYSQNHNLLSFTDKKALMVETAPSKYEVKEIQGIACHANHYVLEGMKDVPESAVNVSASAPRYKVLLKESEKIKNRDSVEPKDLVKILSCHKGKPFSPCRHPSKTATGCTLGTAVFDTNDFKVRIYKGNPCKNKSSIYKI